MQGRLEERRLADVFLDLSKEVQTGILTIQNHPDMLTVSFLEGEVVSADAMDQALEDGLGTVLDSMDLVEPEDFAGLMAEQQAGGGAVADLLVERSFVTVEQLRAALRAHVYGVCLMLLAWREGEYKFYPGEDVSVRLGMETLSVEEILVRASGEMGDQAPLADPLPHADSVFARSVDLEEDTMAGIASEAERLFKLVDGRRTVAQLSAAAEMSEHKVVYLLHRWERYGWVDVMEEAGESPLADAAPAFQEEPIVILEEEEVAPPPPRRRPQPRVVPRVVAWPARVFGLGLLVAVVFALWSGPERFLIPFDWQADLLRELRREQRAAQYLKIHRGAETSFLLSGHFPESLARLVEERMIDAADLTDPEGGPIEYSATAVSYGLQSMTADGAPADGARAESIMGDFFLDPDFFVVTTSATAPLVLLD